MREKDTKKKNGKKKINYIGSEENLKYISRSFYYGTLTDYEYIQQGLVLKLACYTATKYTGTTAIIRAYVPTDMEDKIIDYLITGDKYFLITAPYKVRASSAYPHRIDLLLNIFKEITQ